MRIASFFCMLLGFWSCLPSTVLVAASQDADSAVVLCESAGVSGGLCVLVGWGETRSLAELAATGRFLVHMLQRDPARVASLQAELHAKGAYGLASAELLVSDGALPYTENLVNVIVLGDARVSAEELLRVLCPGGVLLVGVAQPDDAALTAAGFERTASLAEGRWRCTRKPWPKAMGSWTHPRQAADGNTVSSDELVGPPRRVRWVTGPQQEISNMVTLGGRSFFAGVLTRDAFNGLRLWEKKLSPSPARGGFTYNSSSDAVHPIATSQGLLVVDEKKLQLLDAATGQACREYPEADTPAEILVHEPTIVAMDRETIRALDLASGQSRWKEEAIRARYAVIGDEGVFFLQAVQGPASPSASKTPAKPPVKGSARWDNEPVRLLCRDLKDGKLRWEQKDHAWLSKVRGCVAHESLLVCEISTLADDKQGNAIHVLSTADGRLLWSREYVPGSQHKKQARAMFIGDLLWVLEDKKVVGLDPRTGEERKSYPAGRTHCFPPIASSRYYFAGEMDLTDLETGQIDANQITKTACSRDAGVVPANGLIYTFPKHCICWPMLRDYAALAPARPGSTASWEDLQFEPEPGPAHAPQAAVEDAVNQWPCYRHDALRSGSTVGVVPEQLSIRWTAALGDRPAGVIAEDWRTNYFIRGPVGPPVVAGGLVYVTRPDAHQVVALDGRSGRTRWTFTANGRVDTSPTIHRGLCLFGSKSGWVYCLRADNGGLVWRLRAAPLDERIVAYGQIESPWPVPGSVLVVDDVAYFAAGRQSLADGGILVFAVEPATGRVRWKQSINRVPQTNFYGSSGLEFDNFDLLQQEGDGVTMSRWLFQRPTGAMTCLEKSGFARLANGTGSVMFPRGSWSYAARNETEKWKERPYLRPLAVFRDSALFGGSQDRKSVFRRDFKLEEGEKFNAEWFAGWSTYERASKGGDLWRTQRLARDATWTVVPGTASEKQPVAAMILAGERLYTIGAEGALAVLDTKTGSTIGEVEVPAPVWDSLAAAEGQLFFSTVDGQVVCLGTK